MCFAPNGGVSDLPFLRGIPRSRFASVAFEPSYFDLAENNDAEIDLVFWPHFHRYRCNFWNNLCYTPALHLLYDLLLAEPTENYTEKTLLVGNGEYSILQQGWHLVHKGPKAKSWAKANVSNR